MRGDAEALPGRQGASPARFLGCRLDDAAQPAGVERVELGIFAVEPLVGQGGGLDQAVGADQLQQVVLGIALERRRHFGREALDGEGVRDVGDRPEPADARMRLGLRVLDPQVGNGEGRVDGAHR